MTNDIDPIRRMSFTITHVSGVEITGQFIATMAGVTWSLNGSPGKDAALTVDLRTAIERLIDQYNQNGDEAIGELLV